MLLLFLILELRFLLIPVKRKEETLYTRLFICFELRCDRERERKEGTSIYVHPTSITFHIAKRARKSKQGTTHENPTFRIYYLNNWIQRNFARGILPISKN